MPVKKKEQPINLFDSPYRLKMSIQKLKKYQDSSFHQQSLDQG
jgi:hypothetical protein